MSEAATAVGFGRLLSDERLTRRAVDGDERAFGAIFRRYHQSLYRFCLAIVGNPEDAQDALQNTMIKVLRALPGEERKIELKPWLYRIAHNESIDLLRRRRETRELDVEQVAPGYGLAEDVATRERLRRLIIDLKELPERQREVLVMREMAGLGFAEIATAVRTSDAVARQTLYEARQSLRQMEEGREMNCDLIAKALSDGDGRVIRRRDVRAHLRSCADCRGFGEEIQSRQRDLAALSPLPAVAAAGMLQGLLGGSQVASGGGLAAILGGGAAKTVGASAAAKGIATVAVVAVAGVTAADRSGVIHLGLPGEERAKSSQAAPGGGAGAVDAGKQVGGSAEAETNADSRVEQGAGGSGGQGPTHRAEANGAAEEVASPHQGSRAQAPPMGSEIGAGGEKRDSSSTAPGREAGAEQEPSIPGDGNEKKGGQATNASDSPSPAPVSAPTEHGPPSSPPGQSGSAPGKSGSAPGHSGSAPGKTGEAPPRGEAAAPVVPASPPGAEVAAEKTTDAGKGKGKGP